MDEQTILFLLRASSAQKINAVFIDPIQIYFKTTTILTTYRRNPGYVTNIRALQNSIEQESTLIYVPNAVGCVKRNLRSIVSKAVFMSRGVSSVDFQGSKFESSFYDLYTISIEILSEQL